MGLDARVETCIRAHVSRGGWHDLVTPFVRKEQSQSRIRGAGSLLLLARRGRVVEGSRERCSVGNGLSWFLRRISGLSRVIPSRRALAQRRYFGSVRRADLFCSPGINRLLPRRRYWSSSFLRRRAAQGVARPRPRPPVVSNARLGHGVDLNLMVGVTFASTRKDRPGPRLGRRC